MNTEENLNKKAENQQNLKKREANTQASRQHRLV
jgi:hypothetical protein